VVTALAHSSIAYRFAARSADIVFVTPVDRVDARGIVDEVSREQLRAGRSDDLLHVFADIVVFLDTASESGAARKARLDDRAGSVYTSDAHVFTGSAAELAELLAGWQSAGITGYRLRPGALPDDLAGIVDALVPELQSRKLYRTAYEASTLRGLLGFHRPANRYAAGTATKGAFA
jgi:alkanesulfonate monooxygenase SsuD/methylene tetrahydromethanopterin reductase-like flavin-dependent oxidoreductase (luciferase family)